jgi:hypothetical protein
LEIGLESDIIRHKKNRRDNEKWQKPTHTHTHTPINSIRLFCSAFVFLTLNLQISQAIAFAECGKQISLEKSETDKYPSRAVIEEYTKFSMAEDAWRKQILEKYCESRSGSADRKSVICSCPVKSEQQVNRARDDNQGAAAANSNFSAADSAAANQASQQASQAARTKAENENEIKKMKADQKCKELTSGSYTCCGIGVGHHWTRLELGLGRVVMQIGNGGILTDPKDTFCKNTAALTCESQTWVCKEDKELVRLAKVAEDKRKADEAAKIQAEKDRIAVENQAKNDANKREQFANSQSCKKGLDGKTHCCGEKFAGLAQTYKQGKSNKIDCNYEGQERTCMYQGGSAVADTSDTGNSSYGGEWKWSDCKNTKGQNQKEADLEKILKNKCVKGKDSDIYHFCCDLSQDEGVSLIAGAYPIKDIRTGGVDQTNCKSEDQERTCQSGGKWSKCEDKQKKLDKEIKDLQKNIAKDEKLEKEFKADIDGGVCLAAGYQNDRPDEYYVYECCGIKDKKYDEIRAELKAYISYNKIGEARDICEKNGYERKCVGSGRGGFKSHWSDCEQSNESKAQAMTKKCIQLKNNKGQQVGEYYCCNSDLKEEKVCDQNGKNCTKWLSEYKNNATIDYDINADKCNEGSKNYCAKDGWTGCSSKTPKAEEKDKQKIAAAEELRKKANEDLEHCFADPMPNESGDMYCCNSKLKEGDLAIITTDGPVIGAWLYSRKTGDILGINGRAVDKNGKCESGQQSHCLKDGWSECKTQKDSNEPNKKDDPTDADDEGYSEVLVQTQIEIKEILKSIQCEINAIQSGDERKC